MSNFIAIGNIMDLINEKVHEILNERQLDDTAENAGPIFDEVVKQFIQSIRTKKITLHDEVKQIIEDYKRMKERLVEQQKKLDEYISLIKKHHPEFQK